MLTKGNKDIKPRLFLIPGTMCDQTLWSWVSDDLAQHFELHYLVIPIGDHIEQVTSALITQLPKEPVNLIGFSLGGYLASYIACHHADRVERLMVISNSPTQLPNAELKQRGFTLSWLEQFDYQGMTPNRAKQLVDDSNPNFSDIFQLMRTMEEALGFSLLKQQLSSTTKRKDLTEQLAQSPFPCHFVFGDNDKLINRAKLESFNNTHMTIAVAENTGHMLPFEAPKFLAEEMIKAFR